MKSAIDPKVLLIAVPAAAFIIIACAVWQLPRFKEQVDERRVTAYTNRFQPLLAADPRFRDVKFAGLQYRDGVFDPWLVFSGNISNTETERALEVFVQASRPPMPVNFVVGTNEAQDWEHDRLLQLQDKALELEKRASAIFSIDGALTPGGVRLVRSQLLISTNELATLSDFEAALAPLTNRNLAVIRMYAMRFDTNRVTKAASLLKVCGFKEVSTTVDGWGMRFPGPSL